MFLKGMSNDARPPRLWMPRNRRLRVGVAVLFGRCCAGDRIPPVILINPQSVDRHRRGVPLWSARSGSANAAPLGDTPTMGDVAVY